MMEDLSKLPAQVYRLHCSGHAVSKIAGQLALSEDTVRGYITAQWYEDKMADAIAKRSSTRKGKA